MKAFFRNWYTPANATLAIAGDVEVGDGEEAVRESISARCRRCAPPARAKQPPQPVLAAEKKVQLEDRVSLERVYLVWPSAPLFAPGDAELDLLARVLVRVYGPRYALFASLTMPLQTVGARGSVQSVGWRVPRTLVPGKYRFCVLATDKAGNASKTSCAKLVLKKR